MIKKLNLKTVYYDPRSDGFFRVSHRRPDDRIVTFYWYSSFGDAKNTVSPAPHTITEDYFLGCRPATPEDDDKPHFWNCLKLYDRPEYQWTTPKLGSVKEDNL